MIPIFTNYRFGVEKTSDYNNRLWEQQVDGQIRSEYKQIALQSSQNF